MVDASLFVSSKFGYNIWILDDLIIIRDNSNGTENIIKIIYFEFKCRDLGTLKSFLGIEVTRQNDGSIFLT